MLTFEYTARDTKTGEKITDSIQADNERVAARQLSKQGLAPIEIKLKDVGGISLSGRFKGRIKSKDKILFSRQLSTMINAGLPLVQSLRTVTEQTQSKSLEVIIAQVITDVEAGSTFADSLAKHPQAFNTVFVSLVAAGEASGTLDKALERIADQQEKDAEILSKVRGAMIYPAIVVVVIFGVVIFMLTTVLPQVEQLYTDLHQSLPFITAAMLAVSKFITKFWPFLLILMGVGAYAGVKYFQSTSGGRVADRIKMSAPIFGRLFMKMYMARFARTATTLTASGVPMLQMLSITGNAVNNYYIEDAVKHASERVKSGTALSEALKDNPNFLPLVPQMIRIGEQSGSLDAMFEKTAQFYERELDNEIKAISATIEPVLMVVLALVAGLLVGAILLPVYGLVGKSLAI